MKKHVHCRQCLLTIGALVHLLDLFCCFLYTESLIKTFKTGHTLEAHVCVQPMHTCVHTLFIITVKTNEALPVNPSTNKTFTENLEFLKPKTNPMSFIQFLLSQAWSEIHVYLCFAA